MQGKKIDFDNLDLGIPAGSRAGWPRRWRPGGSRENRAEIRGREGTEPHLANFAVQRILNGQESRPRGHSSSAAGSRGSRRASHRFAFIRNISPESMAAMSEASQSEAKKPKSAAATGSSAAPSAKPSPGAGQKTVSKRILLVDDDVEIIESMRAALQAKGYEILVARDGNQGLAMAEREEPALVILDMMMPKRSGFLVLERLRRDAASTPMRVITAITANEGSRHKAYAEMLGVDEYLRKPFAMDRLIESVERLLA